MALLRFELSNRRFIHKLSNDYSERKVIFDAFIPWPEELDIQSQSQSQGIVRQGDVTITCGVPDGPIGSIYYVAAWRDSETDSNHPHAISVQTALPIETFEAVLNANLDTSRIYLTVSTEDAAFTYGYAPDGSEQNWDVGQSNPVKAENITIAVLPQDKPEPEPPEDLPEESSNVALSPTLISDPQLIHHLRAIWWAIVIIGGLILTKLYLGR
jgi:hypothetical protein